jgi:hypothetical protein
MFIAKLKEIDNLNFEDIMFVDQGVERILRNFSEWRKYLEGNPSF